MSFTPACFHRAAERDRLIRAKAIASLLIVTALLAGIAYRTCSQNAINSAHAQEVR